MEKSKVFFKIHTKQENSIIFKNKEQTKKWSTKLKSKTEGQ